MEKAKVRYDLDGKPGAEVTDTHRAHATQVLQERYKKEAERKKAEREAKAAEEAARVRADKLNQLAAKFSKRAELDRTSTQDAAADHLPPYTGISIRDVTWWSPRNRPSPHATLCWLRRHRFDTESKPTFTRGETSTGPHLIQFSTDAKAYLFQIGAILTHRCPCCKPSWKARRR
jgi:ProP effector